MNGLFGLNLLPIQAVALNHLCFSIAHSPAASAMRNAMPAALASVSYSTAESSCAHGLSHMSLNFANGPAGKTTVIGVPPPGGAAGVVKALAKYRPASVTLYPTYLTSLLYDSEFVSAVDWTTIKAVASGGVTIPLNLAEDLKSRHNLTLISGWGDDRERPGSSDFTGHPAGRHL